MENFELTNEQRKYFGLNPIEDNWDRIQWLDTSYIFFDGNTIRKIIHYDPHPNFHTGYIERDYDLQTENREFIQPKTDRGKPKKVTSSNILAFKPINVTFKWTYETVRVECVNNSIVIAKTFDKERFETFAELETWVKNFISSVPKNHFEQLQIIKQTPKPKKNSSYKQGDIFYYQSDKNKFCFGQVLLDLWKIRNCEKFPEEKMIVQVGRFAMFGNPLIVRGFEFCSDSSNPDLDKLLQSNSSGGFYANDYMIYNNICPIIGNRKVEEKEMLFPMVLCADMSKYYFQWGFIEKEINVVSLKSLIKEIKYEVRYAGNVVYHSSIVTPKDDGFYMDTDLNHPKNRKLKEKIFEIMKVSPDITYNEFAKMENELTIGQIFERLK
ncbi:MAG: immunity 26/phosphotriesterase HocA family protein [Tannerella sp.]|jgi:hypothetical protein|nr:immunity 26/phosphotriesterase HocA family protein [Tannerella sp.]